MCGRFNLIATAEQIVDHFALRKLPRHEISYNITPGQKIMTVVKLQDGDFKGVNLHWGLVPSWSKDKKIAYKLINARSETLTEKPSFRSAFKKRRCLIVATGFYEWQTHADGKQAYHIHFNDHALFAFAGLWEHWDDQQETLYSCTIITTAANSQMQPVHERMPVIINPENYARWLNVETEANELKDILAEDAYRNVQLNPISPYVNNPAHNNDQCLI